MISNQQYQINEVNRFYKEANEIEKSPLIERKEGIEKFKTILETDLKHFKSNVEWLIDGSYGSGVQFSFARCTKRMNRRAWLFNNIAVIEYRTSNKMACALWNKLSSETKKAINAILDDCLEAYDLDPVIVEF